MLLLKDEQGWKIDATFLEGENDINVLQSVALKQAAKLLPQAVINFCIHTGEAVVLCRYTLSTSQDAGISRRASSGNCTHRPRGRTTSR